MTTQAADTLERKSDTLYVTDAEIVERMGVPGRLGWALIREFNDKHPTFPKKDKLFGDRRYWPAVRAWFDARNRLKMDVSEAPKRERHVR